MKNINDILIKVGIWGMSLCPIIGGLEATYQYTTTKELENTFPPLFYGLVLSILFSVPYIIGTKTKESIRKYEKQLSEI